MGKVKHSKGGTLGSIVLELLSILLVSFFKDLPKKLWKHRYLVRPSFWVMNYPYSQPWDKELNNLLDNTKFRDIGEYNAKLGCLNIWIANYPLCFHPWSWSQGRDSNVRPSRATIFKAQKLLKKPKYEQN